MARLSSRLKQMRDLRDKSPSPGGTSPRLGGKTQGKAFSPDELGKGWVRIAPYVWKKVSSVSLGTLPSSFPGLFLKSPKDLSRLVMYDFETTGLSGGAGTIIFLAGFGMIAGQNFRIEQLFLADYPGEPDFLREISNRLKSENIYVSYNGKSFDRNILMNRFRLNHLEGEMPLQLDLLYPARTLWKRALDTCSLGQIERDVLDITREEDIPGILIPQCYQDFLNRRDRMCMRKVAAHHLQDVISLLRLLFFFENAVVNPAALKHPEAREGLGILLLRERDRRGLPILEEELAEGAERSGTVLALHYKRTGDTVSFERVLNRMIELGEGLFQCIEMAKFLEHRQKQPEKALVFVEKLLRRKKYLSPAQLEGLIHRKKRLERKCRGV